MHVQIGKRYILCINRLENTYWRLEMATFCVYSAMMVFSDQLAEGGGPLITPFHYIYVAPSTPSPTTLPRYNYLYSIQSPLSSSLMYARKLTLFSFFRKCPSQCTWQRECSSREVEKKVKAVRKASLVIEYVWGMGKTDINQPPFKIGTTQTTCLVSLFDFL